MVDVIVIGAGLFGSITARTLQNQGYSTLVLDSSEPEGASKCSLGVWRPSWVDKIQEQADITAGVFDLIGVKPKAERFFDMDREEEIEMSYVSFLDELLHPEVYKCKVLSVKNNVVKAQLEPDHVGEFEARFVIIAAGVWTDFILANSGYPIIGLDGYWGATLQVEANIDISRLSTWAPYKQNVLHKIDDTHFKFSDGVKVKNPKRRDPRVKSASERIQRHLNDTSGATIENDKITMVREGLRPFLPKGGRILSAHDKNLFSITGGAKNSTVLSGYAAALVCEAIGSKLNLSL